MCGKIHLETSGLLFVFVFLPFLPFFHATVVYNYVCFFVILVSLFCYFNLSTLAGSTIMLLTLPWLGSIILGRVEIVRGQAKDGLRKKFTIKSFYKQVYICTYTVYNYYNTTAIYTQCMCNCLCTHVSIYIVHS